MTMMTAEDTGSPAYPILIEVTRPDKQSRLTNFPLFIGTFIRWVLLIPHIIILYFFGLVAALLYFIATFAILFSGKYPAGMYNFVVGYMRWTLNMTAYSYHLIDKYPPSPWTHSWSTRSPSELTTLRLHRDYSTSPSLATSSVSCS